jgi:hypothetical protein
MKHNSAHGKVRGTNIFFERTKQSKDGIVHQEDGEGEYRGFFRAEDNSLETGH